MNDTENKDQKDLKETPEEVKEPAEVQSEKKDETPGRSTLRDLGNRMPIGPGNFWNNMLSTVVLLIGVTLLFAYLSDTQVKPTELSLSEVVAQVKAGEVKEIVVRGSKLEVTYTDETRTRAEATRSKTDFPARYPRERHRRCSPPNHGPNVRPAPKDSRHVRAGP